MSDVAPGALELVRLFVNTVDLGDGADELPTPATLAAWLDTHRLGRFAATPADLRDARRLREAFRGLLLENNGAAGSSEAAAELDRAAARARLELRFGGERGVALEPLAGGIEGALGRLVGIAALALADGTWSRLKACPAERCGWAFYDHARNRSRRWCSMAVCGNRTKARSYRARHAA